MCKKLIPLVVGMVALSLSHLAHAQTTEHIFQKPAASPADTMKFNADRLYAPFYFSEMELQFSQPRNPFPQSKDLRFPFIYRLAAGMVQGIGDEPFNAPNYGLGVAPPPQFIHHQNVTEYELAMQRIHRYTLGNQ